MGRRWFLSRWRAAMRAVRSNSPEAFALGAAIGVFVAFVPVPGLQVLVAVFLAWLCRASKLAAAAFVWVANPLFFYVDYLVGRAMLPGHLGGRVATGFAWQDVGGVVAGRLFLPMLTGSLAIGFVAAGVTYLVGVRVARCYLGRRSMLEAAQQRGACGE
jgi:uncharacterized protein (DUF2062 family)